MKRHILTLTLALGSFTLPLLAADSHDHHATNSATNPGFEQLKTLVGTWVVADENGRPTDQVASVYRLTAGGTALEETIFPGQEMEMVSVYVPDGQDVVMTHYCMLGNQPQMRAKATKDAKVLDFKFIGGTNLDPAKDKHMHSAVIKFVDQDHLEVTGTGWEDGKPSDEMCGSMKYVRKAE
jgi:hypothetical protein